MDVSEPTSKSVTFVAFVSSAPASSPAVAR